MFFLDRVLVAILFVHIEKQCKVLVLLRPSEYRIVILWVADSVFAVEYVEDYVNITNLIADPFVQMCFLYDYGDCKGRS